MRKALHGPPDHAGRNIAGTLFVQIVNGIGTGTTPEGVLSGEFSCRIGSKNIHALEPRAGRRCQPTPCGTRQFGSRARPRPPTWLARVRRVGLRCRRTFGAGIGFVTRCARTGRAACSTPSRGTVRSDYDSSRRSVSPDVRNRILSGKPARPGLRTRHPATLDNPGSRQAHVSIPISSIRSYLQS